jgi:hypothetical protein
MERPTCKSCVYWDCLKVNDIHEGICRRNAPRPEFSPEFSRDGDYEVFPVIPKTLAEEWCGEHIDFPAWIEAQRKTDPPATVE